MQTVQIEKLCRVHGVLDERLKVKIAYITITIIIIYITSTKISLFGPYCAISETLQNFNIVLELFHFGTAELICQNKVLGVVGGVLGWNTLLIFQSLF